MRRKLGIAVAAVALVVCGAATYAFAVGSSTTQTINGCTGPDGLLRVIAAGAVCRPHETPLSWNTVGPAGDTGPTGASGAAGADGATGATGPQGPAGSAAADPDAVVATLFVKGQVSGVFSDTPIDVTAVSHEIVSPRDPQSGLPTGKRQHKPISITMAWGPTTPLFLNALVTNENLTTFRLSLMSDGQEVARIELTNASVAQYDQHGDNVTFQFTYQKIQWTWLNPTVVASDDWEAPSA
jgi:type VI secretion system secreted protein Hcp